MENRPKAFICEAIIVQYDKPPLLKKIPGCPDGFIWRGITYKITEKLSEWHDYHRRGRMARNMVPAHAAIAEKKGSWGVGQDYYRVRTDRGQIFDIYYDRSPKDINHRKGEWYLFREVNTSG